LSGLFVRVYRKASSLRPSIGKNMPDRFALFADEALLLSCKAQTVVNMTKARPGDTVAPGPFKIRAFVENRSFRGRIHGICDTYDLEGQYINMDSVEAESGRGPVDYARWLIHDTQKLSPAPIGETYPLAYSAGCIVISPSDLRALGDILDAYKVQPGDIIQAELVMEV